jgi:transglutaminase-like putative cysteine protease
MIIAEATVDVAPPASVPPCLENDGWGQLDAQLATGDFWEMLTPSQFSQWTESMEMFARELSLPAAPEARLHDLFELLMQVNSGVYRAISYVPKSTRVDSPVDDALRNRQGVCQDYSHIMLALVRRMGIPCRYVSGYLFHKAGEQVRSTEGATHAWVEAYLPEIGWVGFDPTNNILAGETHVRTAVGRDYADVPPTRGVFKGQASSELTVAVRVAPSDRPPPPETEMESEDWSEVLHEDRAQMDREAAEQQQQ